MSIDWSKAPEGATHYIPGMHFPWCKSRHGIWEIWGGADWQSADLSKGAVASMIKRPAAWDGQGLPPAGTTCEVWHVCHPDDVQVRTIFFIGKSIVVMSDALRGEVIGRLEKTQFRPIRTPEQIAAEEREKARDEVLNRMAEAGAANEPEELWRHRLKVVGEMLDMGYRLVEGGAK